MPDDEGHYINCKKNPEKNRDTLNGLSTADAKFMSCK